MFLNENMTLYIMYSLCIDDTQKKEGTRTILYILLGLNNIYILSYSFFRQPYIVGS